MIEIMNEKQCVLPQYQHRNRAPMAALRKGPKFVKIGASVRYQREDVETWLESCAGMG